MKNNKLIIYKNNIFTKIAEFFKKLFSRKKILQSKNENISNDIRDSFIESIQIKKDKEKLRLCKLKQQYDNGEIDEDDIPDEDVEKLVELYEEETDKLKADTEKIKNHIRQMLKQLQKTKRCDIK